MIDSPEVVETTAQEAAIIQLTIALAEMPKRFGAALDELMGTLEDQGVQAAGPVFAHHLHGNPDTFDFELGVSVDRTVQPVGRVEPVELPAARVARTVYHGPSQGLSEAWGEFDAWLEAEGHVQAPHLWERYIECPHSSSDPDKWRTELNRPVVA